MMTDAIPSSESDQSRPRPHPLPNPNWFQEWKEVQQREYERILAELRAKIGPDGDLRAAYQEWYREQMREHDEGLILMLKNLHEAEKRAAEEQ